MRPRLVVGIAGVSAATYGIRLLEKLHDLPVETHVMVSPWARVTIEHETDHTFGAVKELADVLYSENDRAAAVSSGSFLTRGMDRPLLHEDAGRDRTGFAYSLVCRAADVV